MKAKNKRNILRDAAVIIISAIVFYVCTLPFHELLPVYSFTEIRPSAVLNTVLSIFFGIPGAFGCALGNLFVDLSSGFPLSSALLYFIPQFIYGLVPYLMWRKHYPENDPDRCTFDSMRKVTRFCATVLIASLAVTVCLAPFVSHPISRFLPFAFFCFINDSVINLVLGFPLLIVLNHVRTKRDLCKCEKHLLVATLFEFIQIVLIIVIIKLTRPEADLLDITMLNMIYGISLAVVVVVILISLVFIGIGFNQELEAKNSDLRLAAGIQQSMLPDSGKKLDSRCSVRAVMNPAKDIGGDFYDYFMVGDDRLAFTVADVSGKSMPAALFMTRAISTIRNFARVLSSLEQAAEYINDSLCENNKEHYFVTSWLGVLDLKTGDLKFVNAGHNPPLLRHSDGSAEYIKMRGNPALGMLEGAGYKSGVLHLNEGDSIVLYTDGVTEARSHSGTMFKEENLLKTVESAPHSPEGVCSSILDAVNTFSAREEQFDDITVLVVKYSKSE